jgi:uncharacterized protein (TIGR03435 family)
MKKLMLAAVAVTSASMVRAQTPVAPSPTFDVAAIKQNKSGVTSGGFGGPAGRWTATNTPLRALLTFAYQLRDFQIIGLPDWAVSERWDINAKSDRQFPPNPGGLQPNQTVLMLRALLEDRFKLVAHIEQREAPVYELVLARPDKTLGPELHRTDTDCAALIARSVRGERVPELQAPAAAGRMVCGSTIDPGRINSGAQTMSTLARMLGGPLQRVVIDRTGLKDVFDFTLTYAPDTSAGAGDRPAADANLPSIFTALQEQLGLRLDPTRAPVDTLIVDHVERPTED